jgi:hypothetical protein
MEQSTLLKIISIEMAITFLGLILVLLTFIFPLRKHPPLDWAFINKQACFVMIIGIYLANRYLEFTGMPWLATRVFMWTYIVLSEAVVLYLIYRERRGLSGFSRWREVHDELPSQYHTARVREQAGE